MGEMIEIEDGKVTCQCGAIIIDLKPGETFEITGEVTCIKCGTLLFTIKK